MRNKALTTICFYIKSTQACKNDNQNTFIVDFLELLFIGNLGFLVYGTCFKNVLTLQNIQ